MNPIAIPNSTPAGDIPASGSIPPEPSADELARVMCAMRNGNGLRLTDADEWLIAIDANGRLVNLLSGDVADRWVAVPDDIVAHLALAGVIAMRARLEAEARAAAEPVMMTFENSTARALQRKADQVRWRMERQAEAGRRFREMGEAS